MPNFTSSIYRYFESPHSVKDLFALIDQLKIEISWVIEAGCHNGSDTLEMIEMYGMEKIYAFEPDPSARFEAEMVLAEYLGSRVELSPFALMDKSGLVGIDYLGAPGSGSSQIRHHRSDDASGIKAIKLDEIQVTWDGGGCFWLDVEGVAVEVLIGSLNTLKKISVIKCEVEFHDMSQTRKSNYRKVFSLLSDNDFAIWKCDINPGYFGDILFVRKKHLSKIQLVKSRIILNLVVLIRSYIYPWLGKPQDFEQKITQ